MSTAYAGFYHQQQQPIAGTDLTNLAAPSISASTAAAATDLAEASASGALSRPAISHHHHHHQQHGKFQHNKGNYAALRSDGSFGGRMGHNHRNPTSAPPASKSPIVCNVCNASCTCDEMFQAHLNGAKHVKKVREMNFKEMSEAKDPSVYCEICSLTLHPELMLIHRAGKRHRKAAAGEMPAGGGAVAEVNTTAASHASKNRNKAVKPPRTAALAAATTEIHQLTEDVQPTPTSADPTADAAASPLEKLNSLSKEELIKLITKHYRMECSVCHAKFTTFQLAETHFNSRAHRKTFQQYQSDQIRSKGHVCQVCDLPLNSKELLDAHVQGYKHALRENGNYIPEGHRFYGKYQKALENRMTYRRRDAA